MIQASEKALQSTPWKIPQTPCEYEKNQVKANLTKFMAYAQLFFTVSMNMF